MKLTKVTRQSSQTVIIFGPPKSGKTKLVSELARNHKLLWFDLENGHSTLFQLPQEAQENIDLIYLPDTRSYPIAIETCLKVIKGGKTSICETHGKVDCAICKKAGAEFSVVHLDSMDPNTIVVFDSLTQLTNSAIANITKGQPDDYKLQQDDWGNLGKLMDIFLSHVQQAKFNVICISHETEVEQEDGKMKIVPTAGTKNFSRNTAKYFGHCVYAQVSNLKHKFTSSTTATMNIMAGSRLEVALEKMKEASLEDIFVSRNTGVKHDNTAESKTVEPANESSGAIETSEQPAKTNGEIAAAGLTGLAARIAAKRIAEGVKV